MCARVSVVLLTLWLQLVSSLHSKMDPSSNSRNTALADAAREIVDKVFSREVSVLNVISFNDSGDGILDIKSDLLKNELSSPKITFCLESAVKLLNSGSRRNGNIIIAASYEELIKIFQPSSALSFDFNGFFLIILTKNEISKLQEIFNYLWMLQIHNINIIFEHENQEVKVITFMPFTPGKCMDTSPVEINLFKHKRFTNGTIKFFPEKFENLQNCSIRVSTSNGDDAPYVIADRLSTGGYHLYGSDINLLNTLSEALRFKINYSFIGEAGYCFENGSAEGPLKVLMDGDADLSISNWWLKNHRLKFFDATISYNSEHLIFLIPPGRFLSPMEALVYPFSNHVWMMIAVCFLIGYLVIFAIK